MSHRTPFPQSPGLPPSLYSGMSSLQINQKALLKRPKAARHQSRKSEHPSASTSWEDPRPSVAASAGRKQIRREDAFVRHKQPIWATFVPNARPTTQREELYMLHSLSDSFTEQNVYVKAVFDDLNRQFDVLEEQSLAEDRRLDRDCDAFEHQIRAEERRTQEILDREMDPIKSRQYREFRETYHAQRREALMNARGGPSRST